MFDPVSLVRDLSLALIPFILSLTVHEYAHAWAAARLGDDTARLQGRLTLSPGAHIDPLGTLVIPILSVLAGGMGFIAWAKPVPFNPTRFRRGVNMRLGSAIVAAAGPLSNIVLAILSIGAMALLTHADVALTKVVQDGDSFARVRTPVGLLLTAMWTRNVALALFNLLPFPPLDGHYLLPPVFDPIVKPMSRYGFAILMIVFMFLPQVANVIFNRPMMFVMHFMASTFGVY